MIGDDFFFGGGHFEGLGIESPAQKDAEKIRKVLPGGFPLYLMTWGCYTHFIGT
jgi:hypothetical protein